jgi:hypothetical protein
MAEPPSQLYYFHLGGLPKQGVHIEFTELAGEYNYRAGSHSTKRNTRPVDSYDNQTWTHFRDDNVSWDEKEVRLTVRFRAEQERAASPLCRPTRRRT